MFRVYKITCSAPIFLSLKNDISSPHVGATLIADDSDATIFKSDCDGKFFFPVPNSNPSFHLLHVHRLHGGERLLDEEDLSDLGSKGDDQIFFFFLNSNFYQFTNVFVYIC